MSEPGHPVPWPRLAVLELLCRIREGHGVGSAAREVGMAQPNASRALRSLERDLGLTLVRRDPSGSSLTPEGSLVADWAVRVLQPARELLLATESLKDSARSQLSVGASRTVAEYAVPLWLSALRTEDPRVRVTLSVHNSDDVAGHVRAGTCDIGFVESPRRYPGLRSVVVAVDELVVVVAPSHPWARRRRPLSAQELASAPLVVRESGSGTRTTLEDLLAPHDPAPPAMVLASNESVRITVAAGVGPAVLSALAVRPAVAAGSLRIVPVDGLDLRRRLRAVWRGPDRLRGPAASLVRIARSGPVAG